MTCLTICRYIKAMTNKRDSDQKKDLVVKSNALVNAMVDMRLQELRFMGYCISQIDRNIQLQEGQPLDLEINVKGFADSFDIDPKYAYGLIKNLSDRLRQKTIEFMSGSYEIGVGLISKRKYHIDEGRLWIRFDEDLVPHIIDLKDNFTQYRIKDVYHFQRASTWRVYELLKQYKKLKKRYVDLEDFKWKLGIEEKYPRVVDLKKRIINPAINEINETSDIQVQYETNKRGRNIVGFTFFIIDNENTKTQREKIRGKMNKDSKTNKAPELTKILREEYKVSPKQAKQLANLAYRDEEQRKVRALLPKLKNRWENLPKTNPKTGKPRTSLGGYIFKALKDELTKNSLPGLNE